MATAGSLGGCGLLPVPCEPALVGERMPLRLPPLTREEISVIREWIRRGAPDD